jgi:hypothetical protein
MQKEERSKGKKSLSQRLAIFYLMPMVSTLQFNVYGRKIKIGETMLSNFSYFMSVVTAYILMPMGEKVKMMNSLTTLSDCLLDVNGYNSTF